MENGLQYGIETRPSIHAVIAIEIDIWNRMHEGVCMYVYTTEHIDNSLMIDCKSYLDLYDK